MIKVILFDADGVLINGKPFSHHLANDYNISLDMTAEFFRDIMPDCVVGKKDLKQVLPPYLHEWGWKGSLEEFINYWHISERKIDNELVEYIKTLRAKGIVCCLGTNQTTYRFQYMLKEMGFEKFFDKLYASAHLGYRKPDTKFFKKVIDDLKVTDKKEVLFWDDAQENIDGATLFGLNAELYTSFDDFTTRMKEYFTPSFLQDQLG